MDARERRLRLAAALTTAGLGRAAWRAYLDAARTDPEAEAHALDPTLRHAAERALLRADRKRLAAIEAWLVDPAHHLIDWADPDYPPLLRAAPDPPALLYVAGDPALLWRPQLAIVGSRQASRDGERTARDFARTLAETGFTITSGLALGIDGAAHLGALDATAATIAVLATGLDQIYPRRHLALAERIRGQGALVSESPLGTPARPERFPQRNRIIAGLSLGVLVVEAGIHSGSLTTARLAAEAGREVYAIPGSIHHPLARGCHRLIRDGAKLVESAQDVLDELGPLWASLRARLPAAPAGAPKAMEAQAMPPPTDRVQRSVLEALGYTPLGLDELVERSGLALAQVHAALLDLELDGRIEALPGARYRRLGPSER